MPTTKSLPQTVRPLDTQKKRLSIWRRVRGMWKNSIFNHADYVRNEREKAERSLPKRQ